MDAGIAGRVAFVTGASKGLGRASAEMLAAEGCKVAVIARGQAAIDETVAAIKAAGGTAIGISADLSNTDDIQRAVATARDALGPITIAVFNGMSPKHGTFEDLTEADFQEAYHQFVTCFATMVRAVVPDMKAAKYGRIITIGSRSVKQPLRTHEVPYVLANTHRIAAVGLCKTLANELGPDGITVNTIGTGRFSSESNVASVAEISAGLGISPEDYVSQRMASTPLRRMGRPDEMGALVTFLASVGGGYVTGETICCDGGRNESMM